MLIRIGLMLFLFAGAFFALVDWGTSLPVPWPCRDHENTKNTSANDDKCTALSSTIFPGRRPVVVALGDFAITNEAAITATATVLLAIITAGLVLVGRQQYTTTRAQLRAYVMVDAAHVENIGRGLIPIADITIKNFGVTPAYNVAQAGILGLRKFPLDDVLPDLGTSDEWPITHIGPGGTMHIPLKLSGSLAQSAVDQLVKSETAIYAVGRIKYTDVFDREWHTTYCLFCGGPAASDGRMSAYRIGNNAT